MKPTQSAFLLSCCLVFGLVACNKKDSKSSDAGAGVSAQSAQPDSLDVTDFRLQDEKPIFEWSLLHSDSKLSFVIQACLGTHCENLFSVDCSSSACSMTDLWNRGEKVRNLKVFHSNDNRAQKYRIELCEYNALGFKDSVTFQIQAKSSAGTTGVWKVGTRASLPMDNYCKF